MRRNDKEITDKQEIENILRTGIFCSIAFSDGEEPYLVTVNYGYRDGCIYFHSAKEGRKMDLIRNHPRVCFQVVVDEELVTGVNACRDFTMKYRSVTGYGRALELVNKHEKSKALNVLMNQHTGKGNYQKKHNR